MAFILIYMALYKMQQDKDITNTKNKLSTIRELRKGELQKYFI